jgi:integrase
VKRIDLPKKIRYTGAKHYNEKQIEQLLECSKGDPLEIVILLTVFYGLRRSEVLGLRYESIDFDNNTITMNHTVVQTNKNVYRADAMKNDSSYSTMPLPDVIKQKLIEWQNVQQRRKLLQPNDYIDEGYVCTQFDGRLIRPDYVSAHFKLLLKKNNLPDIRWHDLRHSSANWLLSLGMNLKQIQAWLRHGDIQTTMNTYTKLDLEAKKNISDSLNEKFMAFGS